MTIPQQGGSARAPRPGPRAEHPVLGRQRQETHCRPHPPHPAGVQGHHQVGELLILQGLQLSLLTLTNRSEVDSVRGLAVFEDWVYWTSAAGLVQRAAKLGGGAEVQEVARLPHPATILPYHPLAQVSRNTRLSLVDTMCDWLVTAILTSDWSRCTRPAPARGGVSPAATCVCPPGTVPRPPGACAPPPCSWRGTTPPAASWATTATAAAAATRARWWRGR